MPKKEKKKRKRKKRHLKNTFLLSNTIKDTAKKGSYTSTVQDMDIHIIKELYKITTKALYTTRRSYSTEMELVILQDRGMESVHVFLRTSLSPSSGLRLISLLVSLRDNCPAYIGSNSCEHIQQINIHYQLPNTSSLLTKLQTNLSQRNLYVF